MQEFIPMAVVTAGSSRERSSNRAIFRAAQSCDVTQKNDLLQIRTCTRTFGSSSTHLYLQTNIFQITWVWKWRCQRRRGGELQVDTISRINRLLPSWVLKDTFWSLCEFLREPFRS